MNSTLIQQAKAFRAESRKAFAAYWEKSRQLTDAIARDDMQQVAIMADTMALLLKQAASAEQAAKSIEQELKLEGV